MLPLPFVLGGAYKTENEYILITGEGIQNSTEKLGAFLALHHQEIKKIINFGVCGLLDPGYKEYFEKLIQVRTVYLCLKDQMEFKSYSLGQIEKLIKLDCITHSDRTHKTDLIPFGQVIDRELWAYCSVASKFKIELNSIKCVSDIVNESEDNICELVKEKANFYSDLFFEFYHENFSEADIVEEDNFPSSDSFFFSFSQKKRFISLCKKLEIKDISYDHLSIVIKELESKEFQTKKHRTTALLLKMEEMLKPIKHILEEKINPFKEYFKDLDTNFSYDRSFESTSFQINSKIENEEDMILLSQKLREFPYKKWKEFFKGQIDV